MTSIEDATGIELRISSHEGAEYEYTEPVTGKTISIDQIGDPDAAQNWNPEEFLTSIKKHVDKSNGFTIIDMTDFSDEQQDVVGTYIESLPPESQAKLRKIGF